MALVFPELDPVAASFGPFTVKWYAFAYVIGIVVAYFSARRLNNGLLSTDSVDYLFAWVVIGILAGGRLGYVLFYNAGFYLHNPVEVFKLWKGGMSFHGGFAGVVWAAWLTSRRGRVSFLAILDRLTVGAAVGIFFGRLSNFINGELFGRPADIAWGVLFPKGGNIARHPSQIYEALAEGFLLFLTSVWLCFFTKALEKTGLVASIWVILYSVSRIILEFYRQPDPQIGFLCCGWLTAGQLLSLPLLLWGVGTLCWIFKRYKS